MKRLLFYALFAVAMLPLFSMASVEVRNMEVVMNEQSPIALTVNGDTVRVQNAAPGTMMEIYNVLGAKITSIRIDSTDKTVVLNLPKGYYIFKIGNVVRKVVIK